MNVFLFRLFSEDESACVAVFDFVRSDERAHRKSVLAVWSGG